jgi:uncharacterized protein YecT (DUF1311 family)
LKSDCTPKKCLNTNYQAAVKYLQTHPKKSLALAAERFELVKGSLHKHITVYHPQEAEKYQWKYNCTPEKCLSAYHRAAMKYLQHHPEASFQSTGKSFGLSRTGLRRHAEIHHPQEAKKRQLKSDCTPEKCLNTKYQAAVKYLQTHPGNSIGATERRFGLEQSLRDHVEAYHSQEVEKRQWKSNCTPEKCLNADYQAAVEYLQQHPEARIWPAAKKFKLTDTSLRGHIKVYHTRNTKYIGESSKSYSHAYRPILEG